MHENFPSKPYLGQLVSWTFLTILQEAFMNHGLQSNQFSSAISTSADRRKAETWRLSVYLVTLGKPELTSKITWMNIWLCWNKWQNSYLLYSTEDMQKIFWRISTRMYRRCKGSNILNWKVVNSVTMGLVSVNY